MRTAKKKLQLYVVSFLLVFHTLLYATENADIDSVFVAKENKTWQKLADAIFSANQFSKNYALVIGVGNYNHASWQSLEAPLTDALRIRDYLINEAKFDYVVTLTNSKATKERINQLMEENFPNLVGSSDRFFFYYSGHGTQRNIDNDIKIGYIPLQNSTADSYSKMISMSDFERWDHLLTAAKQTLFVLDCCFSGLAGHEIKSKKQQITIDRLAQYGHHLLTAGTENERSVASILHWNGSLFTDSFLRGVYGAADSDFEGFQKDGIISLTELIEYIGQCIDQARNKNPNIKMSPQVRELSSSEGEFFFINPRTDRFSNILGPVDESGADFRARGDIQIYPRIDGVLFINERSFGFMTSDIKKNISDMPEGSYHLKLVNNETIIEDSLFLKGGYTSQIVLAPSPKNRVNTEIKYGLATGSVRIFSDADSGRVYIDNQFVKYLNINDDVLVENQPIGKKILKVINSRRTMQIEIDVVENGIVFLKFDETGISLIDKTPPAPPLNVRILVP